MWPVWWQGSQPQLSTECATSCLPESTIFFIYNYLKIWFQKKQSRLQLPLKQCIQLTRSPLINRQFLRLHQDISPWLHVCAIQMKEICIQDCSRRQEKVVTLHVLLLVPKFIFPVLRWLLVKSTPTNDVGTPLQCSGYSWCSSCLLTLLSGRCISTPFCHFGLTQICSAVITWDCSTFQEIFLTHLHYKNPCKLLGK